MKFSLALFVSLLPSALLADGFQTCSVRQSQLATRSVVERPTDRALDGVCIAVLPPACGDSVNNHKPCAVRQCLVPSSLRSCPNGEPTMFTAIEIKPFVAKPVKPMRQSDFDAMNRKIDDEARRLAAKWTDNGRFPLSPAALTVLHNISCQVAAATNPDVRCVAR